MAEDFRIRGVIDAEARGFHRAVDGVVRKFHDLQGEHLKTTGTARVLEGQTRALNRELERQSRQLAVLTLQFTALRNAMRTLAVRTAIVGFASLASTVSALAGGIAMLTQQAGLLGVALGTVGASGLMGLGQAAVVATLALKGVGKALTTTGQQHEKAMAKLTTPARAFVHQLLDMQTAFREIKLLAQEGLFPGLTDGLKRAKPALDEFKSVVYDTARVVGYLGDRLGEIVGRRSKDLHAIGERNAVTLRRMGDAALNAGEALVDVFRAADPFIGHVTAGIVTLSQKLKGAAADARKDGSLGHFFFELKETWDTWTATFGNVGGALLNVFRAASGPAREMATAIKETTQKWQDWTGSKSGQRELTTFFESSNRVLGSIAKLLGAVVVSWEKLTLAGDDNAIRFFDGLRTTLLPFLEQLAIALNKGLFVHLMQLGGALIRFATVALPGLQPISEAIGFLVDAVTDLLDASQGLIKALPDVAKLPAAFLITATVLGGWRKLTELLALSLLRIRQIFGLARETPVWGPGLRQLTQTGGRMNPQLAAYTIPGGAGGRGGGAAAPASALSYVRRPVGYSPRTVNNLLADARDRASGAGVGTMFTQNTPAARYGLPMHGPTARPYGAAADPRQWIGSQGQYGYEPANRGFQPYVFRDRMRVPQATFRRVETGRTAAPYDNSPSTVRAGGQRTAAYREFQNIDRTQRGSFTAMAESMGGATNAGIRKGATMARPFLAGAFGIAAIGGIIGALSSDQHNLRGRLQDALSGATFGLVKSAGEQQSSKAGSLAKQIQANRLPLPAAGSDGGAARIIQAAQQGRHYNPQAANIDLTTSRGQTAAKQLIDHLAKAGKIADDDKTKLVGMIDAYAKRVAALGPQAAKLKGAIDSGLDLGGKSAKVVTDLDNIQSAFKNMRDAGGKHMGALKRDVATNMSAISGSLDRKSESGRLALAKNFRLAADAVRVSMKAGAIGTKEGTALIRKYLIDALLEVNPDWNRKQAGLYLHDKDPTTGRPIKQGAPTQGAATGMLTRVPGAIGPDGVPMSVGGRNIVVAPGEDVAVLTRHQRKVVDQRLADMGGLPGLFSNVKGKHHISGFAGGGLVTGDTDYLPAVGKALNSMAAAAHTPIFVQSGRRTMDEQRAAVAKHGLYGPNNPTGAAAPSPNAPHVRGVAADITPGREVFGGLAGRFGLGFTVPGESWHVQLLGAIGDAVATAAATIAPALRGVSTGMSGLVGGLADAGLDKVRDAGEATLQAALSTFGGGVGGTETAPGKNTAKFKGNRAANRELGKQMAAGEGWTGALWRALDLLWTGESGWDNMADNPTSTAFGIPQGLTLTTTDPQAQIRWGLDYIKGRYGDPAKAYSFWLAQHPHWYDTGGLLDAFIAGGSVPPIPGRGGTPTVNPDDAITPGSSKPKAKKKAKKKKPKKPFTSGPNVPDVSKIKGDKAKKPKKAWTSKYGAFAEDLIDVSQLVPDYEALFETPLGNAGSLLSNMQGRFDLTDEEAIVTLTDSGSFNDLSQFWAAHPDLAKTYAGQIDSFDVLNTGGYTVQGKFIPGVNQHVDELLALMGVHTGAADETGAGGGGVVGMLGQYIAAIQQQGIPHLLFARFAALSELKQVHAIWNSEHRERDQDIKQIHKLSAGGGSWEQRVNDNDAKIKTLQDFLRDVDDAAVGHRLTDEARRKKNKVHREIADLRDENKSLRKNKPKARSASASAKLTHLIGSRDEHARELDFLAGSREKWNTEGGVAAGIQGSINAYNTELKAEGDLANRLTLNDLPQEQLEIARVVKEIADWRGTSVILPNVPTAGPDQAAINDLLKQQNDELIRSMALMGQQFKVFEGFAPLVGQRMLGAFAHGGVIDEAGMAVVHKHERMTVEPDPQGPFGSQLRATVHQSGTHLELHLHGGLEDVIRRAVVKQGGRLVTETSQDLGRRSRLLTIAPGGRSQG